MTRFGASIHRCSLLLLVLVCATAPAVASDGALEIHQACVATGCFPGDGPGFPVEITADGGYVLTSNLQVPDENTTAILSTAYAVDIDLGGFTIAGVTECTGSPVTCTPVGTGVGVHLTRNGSVRNGTVHRMGATGVLALGVVEKLRVAGNGTVGISNGFGLTLHNEVIANGDIGIHCSGGVAENNNVYSNGSVGIFGATGAAVRGNRVVNNGDADNSPGILIPGDGLVWNNHVAFNQGPGLQVGGSASYGNNHFWSNNAPASPGNQVTGGTQLGPNNCQGSPCP